MAMNTFYDSICPFNVNPLFGGELKGLNTGYWLSHSWIFDHKPAIWNGGKLVNIDKWKPNSFIYQLQTISPIEMCLNRLLKVMIRSSCAGYI